MQERTRIEKAERQARQATARFDALLDAAVDAIIVIDRHGRIESFNRAATEIFGYAASEIVGRNVRVLMPEPYRSDHDDYMANYIATGEAKIIGIGREATAMRKDGSRFPIELSVGEIREEFDLRFIGLIRDITERKAAETEMRRQRERLAHVTRLSTMGEMTAGIAHEVNQPLTAIATYANACRRIVASEQADIAQLTELLDKVGAQALRAGEVIRRLRSFAKKREGEYELSSMNALVREVAALAEVDAHSHNTVLHLELADEEPRVLVDPVQIQQVLLNLIRNSIEALTLVNKHRHGVTIRTTADEDSVKVEVVDSGPGLDAQIREHLFTPFLTTKESGMGLGLSISHSIIKAHKGSLLYREGETGGSVFYFTLPSARMGAGQ